MQQSIQPEEARRYSANRAFRMQHLSQGGLVSSERAAVTTSEADGNPGSMLSRIGATSSSTLVGDDFLYKVDDVGGRLFRVVFGQHVTLIAAARFPRHEAKHPVKAASPPSFSSLSSSVSSL